MLRFRLIVICLIFFIQIPSNTFADNKVAYLDLDYILSNINVGKTIFKNLRNTEKLKNYKKNKADEINKLKQKRNDEIISLLNLINPIIQDYMSENSISIIIDKKNIYIADKNYDITNNLIEIINKKIK